eukprot:INCI3244.7.p1 GENE.INCI3244.7~~INCI3244.7.p1  ORF type:complete len:135 (-),score=13.59 INCI3244.7:161-565(-)
MFHSPDLGTIFRRGVHVFACRLSVSKVSGSADNCTQTTEEVAWATETLDLLARQLSPTSLKVTLCLMQRIRAGKLRLDQALTLDYRLAQRFCAPEVSWEQPKPVLRGEFMEGIRVRGFDGLIARHLRSCFHQPF